MKSKFVEVHCADLEVGKEYYDTDLPKEHKTVLRFLGNTEDGLCRFERVYGPDFYDKEEDGSILFSGRSPFYTKVSGGQEEEE